MNIREILTGAVVMGPMTKGSNLPYRRLCAGLGAKVLVSEMVLARRLKQRRRGEYALIRRAPEEAIFAVQLAGNQAEEMAWAWGLTIPAAMVMGAAALWTLQTLMIWYTAYPAG